MFRMVVRRSRAVVLLTFVVARLAWSQDSVDVTFRYTPPTPQSLVYLPGEFNGWLSTAWLMGPVGNNTFARTVRLRVGTYQYKFFYPNPPGGIWPNDPLNHRFDRANNDNSILYVRDPTIYQLVPNQRSGPIRTSNPEISAYLFPKVGAGIDTGSIRIEVGGKVYAGLGTSYDLARKRLSFRLPDRLPNGSHPVILSAGENSDTVTITVQAGFVQITNIGNFTTRNPQRTLYGVVEDTSIHSVKIVRNGKDTVQAFVSSGTFSQVVQLMEGINSFTAVALDSTNALRVSEPVLYTYVVNHSPNGDISSSESGRNIILNAQGSVDPDSGQTQELRFNWAARAGNPEALAGLEGATTSQVSVPKPTTPGEYFVTLIVTDPDGNKDTTRSFFTIPDDGSFQASTLATVPRWVREGRVYEMFFKSMTPQGTINAALPYLPYLKSLGVNILWIMPIMENAAPINNRTGTGYNIVDFFKVAPEYGTNQDFKNFVLRAHELGLKVILDITPNHTSYRHPFVLHARQFLQSSPYWTFYQHSFIPHNTNGLGQGMTTDGFVYYSGFSDQLLNYNWADVDARNYMIEVYKWWIREFDVDGYRFDVYWGPHRRAGNGAGNESEMGVPVRKALRKIKPDVLLLAEDDGTGVGTEVIFADRSGGVDAAYDWALYGGAIKQFPFSTNGIENLHFRFFNNGFYPGPNSLFLRFMENHDEERVVVLPNYGSYERSMPVATAMFTVPGLPMIYSGQEVGFGTGISDFYERTRGVINWNAAGKNELLPHYQRLAMIRSQFPAFSTQWFTRIPLGSGSVYAFLRPFLAGDGIVAVNFDAEATQVSLALSSNIFAVPPQAGKIYYANDLYNDTTYSLDFPTGSASLNFRLKPYGSAVFVVSDSLKTLHLPSLEPIPVTVEQRNEPMVSAGGFQLQANYPNPFNPFTTITYELAHATRVRLKVFNLLGEEIATLVEAWQERGTHSARWNGLSSSLSPCPSGVYIARLEAGDFIRAQKMILLR